jgi:hypothetical protein
MATVPPKNSSSGVSAFVKVAAGLAELGHCPSDEAALAHDPSDDTWNT